MIWAEISGKLGSDLWRSEDLLTSTAFGLLNYLPQELGVLALLRRARPVTSQGVRSPDPNWILVPNVNKFEIVPWPTIEGAGVPDLLVHLRQDSQVVHRIIIEVKLYSGKSGSGLDGDTDEPSDEDLEPPLRDQLARYWRGLSRLNSLGRPCDGSIIYLTAHHVPPEEDLLQSLGCIPTMRLAWLSWRDVWKVAGDAVKKTASDSDPVRLIAGDLVKLLHHKGLSAFTGYKCRAPRAIETAVLGYKSRMVWAAAP